MSNKPIDSVKKVIPMESEYPEPVDNGIVHSNRGYTDIFYPCRCKWCEEANKKSGLYPQIDRP